MSLKKLPLILAVIMIHFQSLSSYAESVITTVSGWDTMYYGKYKENPDTSAIEEKNFTVIEVDAQTLELVKVLYSSDENLLFYKGESSPKGTFAYINYGSLEPQNQGEDDVMVPELMEDGVLVVNAEGKLIKKFPGVVEAIWISDRRLFLMQGVEIDGCPDYNVEKMNIFDVRRNKEVYLLEDDFFCGKKPEIQKGQLVFPCCDSTLYHYSPLKTLLTAK